MKILRAALVGFVLAALAACGGGGGGASQPPPVTAPSALTYPAPPAFTVNTAIAALSPTVTGSPTGYTVSPGLPAGLSLNATSGVISGTPTASAAAASYQVTASNAGGSTSTTVSITVKDVAPDVSYAQSTFTFTTGSTVNVAPTSTGGAVVTWSINPALPAGLNLSATTGAITGTPTTIAASGAYVVTAMNSGGSDTFNFTITVSDGVLLNLVSRARSPTPVMFGNRLAMSETTPTDSIWSLFDAQTAAVITQFSAPPCNWNCGTPQALVANTLVTASLQGFGVRSSADGSVIADIPFTAIDNYWWRVAPDGNTIVAGDRAGLHAWSRTGTVLFNKAGDYHNAIAFMGNGVMQIANGAAGSSVIESIALPAGTVSVSPAFNGAFKAWFVDGERFITRLGTATYIYSKNAVQLDIATVTSYLPMGGYGNFYWVKNVDDVNVYEVGNGAATVTTFTTVSGVLPSSDTLSVSATTPEFVDLAGAAPTLVTVNVTPLPGSNAVYASPDASRWVQTDPEFVFRTLPIGGGSTQQFNLGRVLGIVSAGNRVAIATGDKKIRVFDTTTRTVITTIDVTYSNGKIALTADGAMLLVLGRDGIDQGLRFYSLPAGNLVAEWPSTFNTNAVPYLDDFTLARSADRVAVHFSAIAGHPYSYSSEVRRFDGTIESSSTTVNLLKLSPNGARSVDSAGYATLTPTSAIYTGATLSGAANGFSTGWIDDNRILVNFWKRTGIITPLEFDVAKIVDSAGNPVSDSGLPLLDEFQVVSANTVYSSLYNKIFDVTTGATLWSSSTPNWKVQGVNGSYGTGAVTNDSVVFQADALPVIRIESR